MGKIAHNKGKNKKQTVPTTCKPNKKLLSVIPHTSEGSTQHHDMRNNSQSEHIIKKQNDSKILGAEGSGLKEPEHLVICQIRSASQFTLKVQVSNKTVKAVVDTAAQVTIISDKVFNSLKHKPKKISDAKLLNAGRELSMTGMVVGPVRLKIGERWYTENIYVAPIEQEMLLGFDILVNRGQALLDMSNGILFFDGMRLSLDMDTEGGSPTVSRVTVDKRRIIPPHSVAKIKCKMDQDLTDYVIEPVEQSKFLTPRIVREGGTEPIMCLINPTDRYKVVSKGTEIGRAYPIQEIAGEGQESVYVEQVSKPQNCDQDQKPISPDIGLTPQNNSGSNGNHAIPEHLQQLFEESRKNLTKEQSDSLAQLLIEYEDVFAKHEFDLGNFTGIQHNIDTGKAKPVKQRMRRTPVCFAEEEEAHLQKMLKAGVIQESTSDWASAPVLIRKRDGSVRWCIDYRALNEVTVKDVFPLPLIDDCLDTLSGSIWFSKLDANSAYWQVQIKEEDRKKTSFITKYGLFEHIRMGFGLCGAPATYARAMNLVLRGLTWKPSLLF